MKPTTAKLIFESQWYTVTIESKEPDENIEEWITLVKNGLLALGYNPDTVEEYLGDTN